MSGPALLVTGLAVTGSPVVASWLLAGLTVSAAVGGPLLGVLLDRARRPGRMLAWCLSGYAAGLLLVLSGLGRVPDAALVAVAVATGVLGPALTGGWTAQLPLVAGPGRIHRATTLDSMSYNVAGLAGPAVVGVVAAAGDGMATVPACVGLLVAAAPVAWLLPSRGGRAGTGHPGTAGATPPSGGDGQVAGGGGMSGDAGGRDRGGREALWGELVAGFAVIVRNPALRRATAGSMISCAGAAMLVVSAPVLGVRLTGESGYGALLLTVTAASGLTANAAIAAWGRAWRWDTVLVGATMVLGAGTALAAVAAWVPVGVPMGVPGAFPAAGAFWAAVAGAAVAGAGEGPQLTALFSVRHREAPARLRAQVFTTGASLKITSFAVGSALAGPLAACSVVAALAVGAALQGLAVVAMLLPPARPPRSLR